MSFALLIFLLGMNLAHATSTARIQGSVDWSSATITVNGSVPNYVDKGSYSQANAGYSDSLTPPDEEWGPRDPVYWGTTDAQKAAGNGTYGHTWTTENGIYTDAYALADGINNTYGRAASWVYRIGYFAVSEDSTLDVSVTFNLQQHFQHNPAFEGAGGYHYIGIGLGRVDTDTGITELLGGPNKQFWYNSTNNNNVNGSWSSSETLTMNYSLTGGYTYSVDAAINSDAHCTTSAVFDSDGDNIPDNLDACPIEDATGFDANGDGCIDTTGSLAETITTLVESGVLAESLQRSLLAKVGRAERQADKENICAAVRLLETLKRQVDAKRGRKISDEAADVIIVHTESVIAYLLSQLSPGDRCHK
jgi:hypothetical protein